MIVLTPVSPPSGQGYCSTSLSTLRTLLQLKWESVPFWSNEEARTAINEALRVWNMLTGMWKRRETITTIANQVWYSLTSTMVYELRMDFGMKPMELTSITDLNNGRPGWEGESTLTTGAPAKPTLFAPAGLTLVGIWPADAAGGNQLVLDSVRQTPVLVNDTDCMDYPNSDFSTLLGFALHVASFKEGGRRFSSTQRYRREFLMAAAQLNSRLKASAFFRREMGLDMNRVQMPMELPTPPPQAQPSNEQQEQFQSIILGGR